jgi:hypothetical protein
MTVYEEFIRGIAFGIGFTIISLIGDYIKAKLKKRRSRVKKVPALRLVKNR